MFVIKIWVNAIFYTHDIYIKYFEYFSSYKNIPGNYIYKPTTKSPIISNTRLKSNSNKHSIKISLTFLFIRLCVCVCGKHFLRLKTFGTEFFVIHLITNLIYLQNGSLTLSIFSCIYLNVII